MTDSNLYTNAFDAIVYTDDDCGWSALCPYANWYIAILTFNRGTTPEIATTILTDCYRLWPETYLLGGGVDSLRKLVLNVCINVLSQQT